LLVSLKSKGLGYINENTLRDKLAELRSGVMPLINLYGRLSIEEKKKKSYFKVKVIKN